MDVATGTKPVIIDRLKAFDTEIFIEIHRSLSPIDLMNVERNLFFHSDAGDEVNDRLLCTLNPGVEIRGESFRTLSPAQESNAQLVRGIMELFRKRDEQIKTSFDDVNAGRRNSNFKPSVFCPPQFAIQLLRDPVDLSLLQSVTNQLLPSIYRIYCPVEINDGGSLRWNLFVLDIHRKCFYHFDPATEYGSHAVAISVRQHFADIELNSNYVIYSLLQVTAALNSFLHVHLANEMGDPWQFTPVDVPVRYEVNEDNFSSGVYIFTILYYTVCEIPIALSRTDMLAMRRKWAHWILLENLPI